MSVTVESILAFKETLQEEITKGNKSAPDIQIDLALAQLEVLVEIRDALSQKSSGCGCKDGTCE